MKSFLRVLGWIWASPLTIPCFLFYIGPAWALGWYRWIRQDGDALVWIVGNPPSWLERAWQGWGGQTLGNLVVLRLDPSQIPQTLVHEKEHVSQCMRFGIFQAILYGACDLAAVLVGEQAHRLNPFEVSARRKAGQDPFGR